MEPAGVPAAESAATAEGAAIYAGADWSSVFSPERKAPLERILPAYLRARKWFRRGAQTIQSVRIADVVPFGQQQLCAAFVLVTVSYTEGDPEMYFLPLTFALGERARRLQQAAPDQVITRLATTAGEGILTSALLERELTRELLEGIARRRQFRGREGVVTGVQSRVFRKLAGPAPETLEPNPMRSEQDSTFISFENRLVAKVFRRLDEGRNPDCELGLFLTEKIPFAHIPTVAGFLEYQLKDGETRTLSILQEYIRNEDDAWHYTLDILERYFERMASHRHNSRPPQLPGRTPLDFTEREISKTARELIGVYLESARMLGKRTAELHTALAACTEDPRFSPEPFTPLYQRSIYQSMRSETGEVFELLKKCLALLPEDVRRKGSHVLARKEQVRARLHSILERKFTALRTRIHGQYHLGKILYTGKDFVIIDLEGQASLSLGARRIKKSPLRDVAEMLCSLRSAAHTALATHIHKGGVPHHLRTVLKSYADYWSFWVSAAFLNAYLRGVSHETFIPRDRSEVGMLLDMYQLEKALRDLNDGLIHRPDQVEHALDEVSNFLDSSERRPEAEGSRGAHGP
jgi:maltose alpha-D-glucosyltransferase/alpha-amylase